MVWYWTNGSQHSCTVCCDAVPQCLGPSWLPPSGLPVPVCPLSTLTVSAQDSVAYGMGHQKG